MQYYLQINCFSIFICYLQSVISIWINLKISSQYNNTNNNNNNCLFIDIFSCLFIWINLCTSFYRLPKMTCKCLSLALLLQLTVSTKISQLSAVLTPLKVSFRTIEYFTLIFSHKIFFPQNPFDLWEHFLKRKSLWS